MQYFSIDIETTGLNPNCDQILQIGIAFEDTDDITTFKDIPKAEVLVKHKRIEGQPFAINMNQDLIRRLADKNNTEDKIWDHEIEMWLRKFINIHTKGGIDGKSTINVAGKNFNSFDRVFLEKHINPCYLRFRHRAIDPAMLCIDWTSDKLPSLQECLENCKENGKVKHTAVEDALDVIRIIRLKTKYYTKGL